MVPGSTKWQPPLNSWALKTLREGLGWTQEDLARVAGTSLEEISRCETGKRRKLSREKLGFFADRMGYEPAEVDELLQSLRRLRRPRSPRPWSPVGPSERDLRHIRQTVRQAGLADGEAAEKEAVLLLTSHRARRDRARAARFWSEHLLPCPAEQRRLLIAASPFYSTWALAELLAHESAKAACEDAKAALHLAELTLQVAEEATATAPETWRVCLLGYVWAFVANARRVDADLDGAEEASARGCTLWRAGENPAGLLAAWRVPDLKASLRRDQRRFAEALVLHEEAVGVAPREVRGRVLLKKAATLEQMTDYESALETLAEAESWIEATDEPWLRFGLCCGTVVVLLHLGRVAQVGDWFAEAQDLVTRLGGRRDQARVRWIEGRIAYELGNLEAARTAFEQARRAFASLGRPCDFALVMLDLALLGRDQGRWREVRSLAAEVVALFERKHVLREALASVILFQEAAAEEAVTGDLVRRLQGYLTAVQRNPRLRFER